MSMAEKQSGDAAAATAPAAKAQQKAHSQPPAAVVEDVSDPDEDDLDDLDGRFSPARRSLCEGGT